MRTLSLVAVFQDGSVPADDSAPLAPYAQGIAIPQWTDCRIDVTCLASESTEDEPVPFDISGGALLMSVKARPTDTEPVMSFEATIDDGPEGLAHFVIGSVDSGITAKSYGYVVVFIDSDGYIWPVVAEGTFAVTPSEYIPGQEVTVPESQEPLAQGPGFTDRGAYSAGTAYSPRDVVTYEVAGVTSTYACILASTGNAPTNATYWELWASGAEEVPLSDATPAALGTASAGASVEASRADHVHPSEFAVSQTQTVGANSAEVSIYTLAPNSGALLRINVAAVSDNFSTSATFESTVNCRRDGSGDGAVGSYSLLRSSINADISGISIQLANAATAGVFVLTVNGKANRTIDWTISVLAVVATRT